MLSVIFPSSFSFGLECVNSGVYLEGVVASAFLFDCFFPYMSPSDGRQGSEHQASFPKISTCGGRISKCMHM